MLTSIQTDITYAFGYSRSSIIYTSSANLFGAISISVFNSILIEKMGTRWSLIIASVCLNIAAWGRLMLPKSIDFIIFVFVFAGFGAGFALNTILKFCNEWFPSNKRPFYYSFLTLGTLLGSGLGPVLPYIFIREDTGTITQEIKRKHIMLYIWVTTIFASVHLLCIFFFMKGVSIRRLDLSYENIEDEEIENSPKKQNSQKQSFFKTLLGDAKNLFQDKDFLKMLFLITVSKGSFLLLNSILVIVITNLNFGKIYGTITIDIGLFFGLSGSIFYSKFFAQKKDQAFFLSLFLIISLIVLTVAYMFILYDDIVFFMFGYAISGFFSYPLIPMYFNLASKKNFNASLSSVNSFMMLFPQLSTFLLQLISSLCFKVFGSHGSFMVILFIIFLYLMSFFVLRYVQN
jgi:MFS family permease